MAENAVGTCIRAGSLAGKVIDVHAHVGVSLKAYASSEYPYAQSLEGLYYRQKANGVDCGVVFTYTPELYFKLPALLRRGRMKPAGRRTAGASAPYALENRLLFTELFQFCPELADRFLPFVSVDPVRKIREQLAALEELAEEYPVYGIKVSPVLCQSRLTGLLEQGEALLEFAARRDLPVLLHVTVDPREEFSQAADGFRVAELHPSIRFCLAHCIGFDREFLERADGQPNVWVDTSALKIQVEAAFRGEPFMAGPGKRFDWDYADHLSVMKSLVEHFPDTIVWGSDSPCYSYIVRRLQAEGNFYEFRLKGSYEQEKAALDALAPEPRRRVCSENTAAFLFGETRGEARRGPSGP
jgi:predicted TIM-barrel fold metal-dependent hydrolase